MPALSRLCILWPRFGPYHLARLDATQRALAPQGVEVIGLETAGRERLNQWAVDDGPVAFTRVRVFPDRVFEDVPPREMEQGVTEALDRLRPDAVAIMSYSYPDARAAIAWCRRNRRVAIMMFDSRREDAPRSAWREEIKRALVGQFDAALVAGTPHQVYASDLGIPLSHVFSPVDVVDNAFFAEGAAKVRQATPSLPNSFLTVSRLTPVKGVDILLEAYRQYRAASPDPWPLAIVGDGPERVRLEREAPPGVSFKGFAQIDALPGLYGHASAFVFPTHKDTWGLVVNEAMAAGLPVIVSTGAGCALDLVDEGKNGFAVPAGDPIALADRLRRMAALSDEEREAMGDRSREIISRFRLDDFSEGLWAAAQAGRSRADRGLSTSGQIVLSALRLAARHPRAFHAIPD